MGNAILVTGAAGGKQGRTGRRVAESLLKRGFPVRAFVHQLDPRSEELAALGAEIHLGNFLDFASVQKAVTGAKSVYFAYPVQEGLLDATAIMGVAARQAGVERLVNLVMLLSTPDAPTPRMRQNFFSENVFEWAEVGVLHLRATIFFENIASLVRHGLSSDGVVRAPLGNLDTVWPLIAAEDVSRVASSLLADGSAGSENFVRLIGTTISLRRIIQAVGDALGRDVHYEQITTTDWQTLAKLKGYNAHAITHLMSLYRAIGSAAIDPNDARFAPSREIQQIGGSSPTEFSAFATENRGLFLDAAT